MTTATDTPTPTTPSDAVLDALLERFPAPPLHPEPSHWQGVCWRLIHGEDAPATATATALHDCVVRVRSWALSALITMGVLAAPLLLSRLASGR